MFRARMKPPLKLMTANNATTSNTVTTTAPSSSESKEQLDTFRPTLLQKASYKILSVIPGKIALTINNKISTPATELGDFKRFTQELQQGLNITGNSPEFFINLVNEYITIKLTKKMNAGELLAYHHQNQYDLKQAYDPSNTEKKADQYKLRTMQGFTPKFDTFALKYLQSMRAKDPNSFVAKGILTVQSDLPSPSAQEVGEELQKAFLNAGTMTYADNFSNHFKIKKILGAGTIGISAFATFIESPGAKEKDIVFKLVRKGARENIEEGYTDLVEAAENLLAQKKASAAEVKIFKDLMKKQRNQRLFEINNTRESLNIAKNIYQAPGITTVSCNQTLAGKASGVVFMDKAQGVECAKFLHEAREKLAQPGLSSDDRKALLDDIASLRSLFSKLAVKHLHLTQQNLPVHSDLHGGNVFFDKPTNTLSVLDLGSVADATSEAAHLQMSRFSFFVNLAAATGDANYLQMFYEEYQHHPSPALTKPDAEKVKIMLDHIQIKLDQLKNKSKASKTIDSEQHVNEVLEIIMTSALTQDLALIPEALIDLARSSQLLTEELTALRKDLAGSIYEARIPYLNRTMLGMVIQAAFKENKVNYGSLWTQPIWDYFVNQTLNHPDGFEQLKFEKKFIYGIFGFSENEAAAADLLIPGAIIAAPVALYCSAKVLAQGAKALISNLPELALSYRFMQTCKKIQGAGAQHYKDYLTQLNDMFAQNKLSEKFNKQILKTSFSALRDRLFSQHKSTTKIILPEHKPTLFRNPRIKKAATLVVGVSTLCATTHGAKKIRDFRKQ